MADDDDIIDKAEFIILCMVRIGAASPMLIKKIVEFYNELDVDGEGVDADEMSTTVCYVTFLFSSIIVLYYCQCR